MQQEHNKAEAVPAALASLPSLVAEEVHEAWQRERLRNGWQYGPQFDSEKKLHPCMVPFDKLSEEERALDRATAAQVICSLLKLGCEIILPKGGEKEEAEWKA